LEINPLEDYIMTDSCNWAVVKFNTDGEEEILGYFSSFDVASRMCTKLYEVIPNTPFGFYDAGEFEHDGICITNRYLSPCGRFHLSEKESIAMYGEKGIHYV
tara:strand:- start:182 stop:487 length:306 start_codon:yes stop_codon:yes gene_type:complete